MATGGLKKLGLPSGFGNTIFQPLKETEVGDIPVLTGSSTLWHYDVSGDGFSGREQISASVLNLIPRSSRKSKSSWESRRLQQLAEPAEEPWPSKVNSNGPSFTGAAHSALCVKGRMLGSVSPSDHNFTLLSALHLFDENMVVENVFLSVCITEKNIFYWDNVRFRADRKDSP